VTLYDTSAQRRSASQIVSGARCWILSDGKAGDEAQCLGVSERLGLVAAIRRIAPRMAYALLAPYGPIDPKDRADHAQSPLHGPLPDIVIASGRRTVPYVRYLKRRADLSRAGAALLTVYLKDPRIGKRAADLIWVPQHDRLRGDNVVVTLTSPHRISPERLAAERAKPPPWGAEGRTTIGVVLGGDSQHHRFTSSDIAGFMSTLTAITAAGARLIVTPSRRTPPALAQDVAKLCATTGGFFWDGEGTNPYLAILAHADHLIVTADSVNMLGEAAATGTPIHVFTPTGGHTKISSFVKGLFDHGAVRPLGEHLESWAYPPLDATDEIAARVADSYARLRQTGLRKQP
jgi:uncharacterized protein